jgi:transposase-like protein
MSQLCPKNACRQRPSQGPTKVIGHGWFPVRHGRRRRYRCLGCGGTFSRRSDTAYYRLRCSRRGFDRVSHLAVEGMSRAAIARVEGIGWVLIEWTQPGLQGKSFLMGGQVHDCRHIYGL